MFKTLLLWGWDNILVDTYPAILAAQNDMLTHFGKAPLTEEQIHQVMSLPRRHLIQEIFSPEQQEAAWQYYLNSYRQHASHIQLKPGAPEVLQAAKSLGFISVLGSHKQGSLLRTEADGASLNHFFDRMIGTGDAAGDKPSHAFAEAAVAGFDANIIITIGDTPSDIQLARYFPKGISLFVSPENKTPSFGNLIPDKTYSNLFELRTVLEKRL